LDIQELETFQLQGERLLTRGSAPEPHYGLHSAPPDSHYRLALCTQHREMTTPSPLHFMLHGPCSPVALFTIKHSVGSLYATVAKITHTYIQLQSLLLHSPKWTLGQLSAPITGSTVVLTCCKGDGQSQWKTPIFGPSQLRNPLTDYR